MIASPSRPAPNSNPLLKPVPHFWLLDIVRGLAALAVVVWHYQHFYYIAPGQQSIAFTPEQQPLFQLLRPFYVEGFRAVHLFFLLSGFIFFSVYLHDIGAQRISAWQFSVLRFSRLYPLHLATLLLVAVGQLLSQATLGSFIVYPFNDAYHFVLNLLMATNWGLQKGPSFNAPIWSVSIEILLYFSFFIVARVIGWRTSAAVPLTVAMLSLGLATARFAVGDCIAIGRGIAYFYTGALMFLLWKLARGKRLERHLLAVAAIIAVASTVAYTKGVINSLLFQFTFFPAGVLALALYQAGHIEAGRSLRTIGDITYATYLIHFPIQLILIFADQTLGLSIDYASPLFLIGFLAIVVLTGTAVYHYFEKPSQKFLRSLAAAPTGIAR